MPQLALKVLSASDLTFFDWHFQRGNVGNQKAINLNADVFISKLYPLLPPYAAQSGGKIPIDLFILGPGLYGPHNLQRKIVKATASYKNWRLNGEVVHDPEDDPSRYHGLAAGDLALFWFSGELIAPNSLALMLISLRTPADVSLHAQLMSLLGGRGMVALAAADVEAAVLASQVPDGHPIRALTSDRFVDEVVESGGPITRPPEWAFARPMTREELQRLTQLKGDVGQDGELLVATWLSERLSQGGILGWEWVSEGNAVAPWDFKVDPAVGGSRCVDVKSTTGPFENPIHVSRAELNAMANGPSPYDIYRVFEMSSGSAHMRIADDMRTFAQSVLGVVGGLPQGVVASKFAIDPAALSFSAEVILLQPDAEGALG